MKIQNAENTKIWNFLTKQYKKNPIGYRFMKKQHEKKGLGGIKRRLETILLLPLIPFYNFFAIQETKQIRKKGSIFYIRNKNVAFYLPDLDLRKGDYIQNLIFLEGDYFDVDQLKEIKKYIPNHAVILDIGTNIGNHTIFFAKECYANKIYSFEPTEKTFSILTKNLQINHLEELVDAKNIALGDQKTKADVICVDEKNCGGNKVNKNSDGTVIMETLDNLSIKEKIDFIKIDVEGFEYEVLKGGMTTIDKNRPYIYVEIFDQNYDKVNHLLKTMGYVCIQKWRRDYLYQFKAKS